VVGTVYHKTASNRFTLVTAIPNDAPFGNETSTPTYITPTAAIIGIMSVLLGLGDSAYNTQIMGILGHLYKVSYHIFIIFSLVLFFQLCMYFFHGFSYVFHEFSDVFYYFSWRFIRFCITFHLFFMSFQMFLLLFMAFHTFFITFHTFFMSF